MAATNGIASLLGEAEFGALIHQGEKESVHISFLGERMILVMLFDEQSSLGLVRLRVDQARAGFEELLQQMLNRSAEHDRSLEVEMTGEDIDNLLRDA
jgi:predicted regulator of Ras-like GTPase activity (Roadblock/LC7/MglB family)